MSDCHILICCPACLCCCHASNCSNLVANLLRLMSIIVEAAKSARSRCSSRKDRRSITLHHCHDSICCHHMTQLLKQVITSYTCEVNAGACLSYQSALSLYNDLTCEKHQAIVQRLQISVDLQSDLCATGACACTKSACEYTSLQPACRQARSHDAAEPLGECHIPANHVLKRQE